MRPEPRVPANPMIIPRFALEGHIGERPRPATPRTSSSGCAAPLPPARRVMASSSPTIAFTSWSLVMSPIHG